ncbi:MAG: aminoglycoside phosphotransferase family protein [Thermoanaerobaculia bacterium]|nr:aminoglycoside phosphotransferase family protein [Thermoanaerobaculia bacterium]
MKPGTPEAEADIDRDLVGRLLADQYPDLAGEPLHPGANGWDNVTWRLGESLAVRLPRRAVAAQLIRNEQRWLPAIARRVSVPIPEPVRTGTPGAGYPWPWSIVPWIPGETAVRRPLAPTEAAAFGRFLRELHEEAPSEAPDNPFRGVPLTGREAGFLERMERLEQMSGASETALRCARHVFAAGLDAEACGCEVWLHGDLHPKNVLTLDGRLAGVVDWGDLTGGDPATDLAAAWMHFPPQVHATLWRAYGLPSRHTLARARAWAALFGVIFLDTGLADDPAFVEVGRTTLRRLVTPDSHQA